MSTFFKFGTTIFNTKFITNIYIQHPTFFNKNYYLVIRSPPTFSGNFFWIGHDSNLWYYKCYDREQAYNYLKEIYESISRIK